MVGVGGGMSLFLFFLFSFFFFVLSMWSFSYSYVNISSFLSYFMCNYSMLTNFDYIRNCIPFRGVCSCVRLCTVQKGR